MRLCPKKVSRSLTLQRPTGDNWLLLLAFLVRIVVVGQINDGLAWERTNFHQLHFIVRRISLWFVRPWRRLWRTLDHFDDIIIIAFHVQTRRSRRVQVDQVHPEPSHAQSLQRATRGLEFATKMEQPLVARGDPSKGTGPRNGGFQRLQRVRRRQWKLVKKTKYKKPGQTKVSVSPQEMWKASSSTVPQEQFVELD